MTRRMTLAGDARRFGGDADDADDKDVRALHGSDLNGDVQLRGDGAGEAMVRRACGQVFQDVL